MPSKRKSTNNNKPVRRTAKVRKAPRPRVNKPMAVKAGRRHGLLKLFIVAVTACLCLAYLIWRNIDTRVVARLNSIHNPQLPVIYSSPFDLSGFVARLGSHSPENISLLRAELIERRYSEVPGQPLRPGDYSVSSESIQIYTRPYIDYSGVQVDGRKRTIGWSSGSVGQPRVFVEPQVISVIGSADTRASSFIPLSDIPVIVQHAVLSIEDERFYRHFGLDFLSIGRAALRNILARRLVQGGSTLTQQLAKNLFLSPKRSFWRKLQEVPTALSIEKNLSKSQILELYLNEVYLGQEGAVAIHGMPEAASAFFGKKLQNVTVDEAATLAGMIKAPSLFNPRRYPSRAQDRRNTVLSKMRELGYITETELRSAHARPIRTVARQEHRRLAPYFTSALETELGQVLDLQVASRAGLTVHTGIDLGLQRCAERAIEEVTRKLELTHPRLRKGKSKVEAALVAVEPYSGLVKAWVGGRDFSSSQFNRVSQAHRQIGSTIKPFVYLTALDGSLNSYKVATAASIVEDKPMEFRIKGQKAWNPENYDHDYRGDVTVRYALENSLNMPALYIAERVGLPAIKRTIKQVGLSAHDFPAVPSLALGALDTNLLRLTGAYSAIANGGIFVAPRMYSSAIDGDNERLSAPKIQEQRVAGEAATFVLTNILQGVLDRGTGKAARSKGYAGAAAGKTGTSDSARDAWFVGFTPTLTAGVWVGFDDNRSMNLSGGAAAAPIWGAFMSCAKPYVAEASFLPPQDVVLVPIDTSSGMLAANSCPSRYVLHEVFVRGTEPDRPCPHHATVDSDDSHLSDVSSNPKRGFWSRFLP